MRTIAGTASLVGMIFIFCISLTGCKGGIDPDILTNDVIAQAKVDIEYPVTGQEITFTGNATGGIPPYTNHWDFDYHEPDFDVDSESTNATHTYSLPGIYHPTLRITDNSGKPCGPDAFSTVELNVGNSCQPDNNDSHADALEIQFSGFFENQVVCIDEDETDWYKFTYGPLLGSVRIVVTNDTGPLEITLYDESQAVYPDGPYLAREEADPSAIIEFGQMTLNEGTYYIRVRFQGDDYSPQQYTLQHLADIDELIFNPVEITPEGLNFYATDMAKSGNNAVILSRDLYLYIYDCTDPENPVYINKTAIPDNSNHIAATGDPAIENYGGYALVTSPFRLNIIDIDPPESVHTVGFVGLSSTIYDLCISGGYAYLLKYGGLMVVDIDPLEYAAISHTYEWFSGIPYSLAISEGYAYVSRGNRGLDIVDVRDLDAINLVQSIDTLGSYHDVTVVDDKAYVAIHDDPYYPADYNKLQIINVETPEDAYVETTLETPDRISEIVISGNYAYCRGKVTHPGYYSIGQYCLQIIDISQPEPVLVSCMDSLWDAKRIVLFGDYIYAVDGYAGVPIIDVNPPESTHIIKTVMQGFSSSHMTISDGYMYSAEGLGYILDIDPPETTSLVGTVNLFRYAEDIVVSDGFAYIADEAVGLAICDIDPPESAHLVSTVTAPHLTRITDLTVSGNKVYAANSWGDLFSINVDSPEAPFVEGSIDLSDISMKILASGGFLYIEHYDQYFWILDVDPFESAYIVKELYTAMDYTTSFLVSDGYAYLTGDTYGSGTFGNLLILDIDPPESSYVIKNVMLPERGGDLVLAEGYALVTLGSAGLAIIDVEPIESAYLVEIEESEQAIHAIEISGRYAFTTDALGRLRILQLW